MQVLQVATPRSDQVVARQRDGTARSPVAWDHFRGSVRSGDGMTTEAILTEHPDLEDQDIAKALHYAALAVSERELPLRLPA